MSKKDLIAKLLDKLSEEDLSELLSDDSSESQEDDGKHVIRRRGSGHNKRNKSAKKTTKAKRQTTTDTDSSKGSGCRVQPMKIGKRKNKFEDFIENVSLDASEASELAEATEDDKKVSNPRKKQQRRSTLIEVRCLSCGKEHTVSQFVVASADRWKCNSCCCSGR